MAKKIAVVTGANKGIGYSCVKQLAEQIAGPIYLTSRNEKLGTEAVEKMKTELGSPNGDKIKYHQLDVTQKESIQKLRDYLKTEHNGLDILVNNAGLYIAKDKSLKEQNDTTMAVNYFGVKHVVDSLSPLLNPHARVVIVASRAGNLRNLEIESLREQLAAENLTEAGLNEVMNKYLADCETGKQTEMGYPDPYYMSKIFVIALMRVYNRQFKEDNNKIDILINAVCPGMVVTDLTSALLAQGGNPKVGDEIMPGFKLKTPDDGADTLVYCSLLPENGPSGEFIAERKLLDWPNEKSMKEAHFPFEQIKH